MRIAIDWAQRGRELAVLTGIGTFLSILNPFNAGTALEFWQTWLYWNGLVIYGSVIGALTSSRLLRWMEGLPIWLIIAAIAATCALFVTPVLILLNDLANGNHVPLRAYPRVYGLALVISIGITVFGFLVSRASSPPEAETSDDERSEAALRAFMSRLPIPFRNGELYGISSEDHYLRIHTSVGEHLFLERLSNAVHALEPVDGFQVHRSWWVAEDGVESATTTAGKITLKLKSGTEVPVSRTYAPKVREAGWI